MADINPNNASGSPPNKSSSGGDDIQSTSSSDDNTPTEHNQSSGELPSSSGNNKTKKDREPFFQFVPDLVGWSTKIVGNEVGIAQRAVIGFPKWSSGFVGDTYTYYKKNPRILFDEIISGFTVAIMQVPESIAFSFVAGVPPLSGLQATFWMALITGIFGGKPGMISGKCLRVEDVNDCYVRRCGEEMIRGCYYRDVYSKKDCSSISFSLPNLLIRCRRCIGSRRCRVDIG